MDERTLQALAEESFQRSIEMPLNFFEQEADQVAQACLAMARRFHQGGRLLAFGAGNSVTDAQHVSVEFVHPVIVGKRALPAIALGTDVAATVGLAGREGWTGTYAAQVDTVARTVDMAIGIDVSGNDGGVLGGLRAAAERGLLTVGLGGGDGGAMARASLDFCFVVPSADPVVVQETHETLYHVLWELVHVFFEHKHLLAPQRDNGRRAGSE